MRANRKKNTYLRTHDAPIVFVRHAIDKVTTMSAALHELQLRKDAVASRYKYIDSLVEKANAEYVHDQHRYWHAWMWDEHMKPAIDRLLHGRWFHRSLLRTKTYAVVGIAIQKLNVVLVTLLGHEQRDCCLGLKFSAGGHFDIVDAEGAIVTLGNWSGVECHWLGVPVGIDAAAVPVAKFGDVRYLEDEVLMNFYEATDKNEACLREVIQVIEDVEDLQAPPPTDYPPFSDDFHAWFVRQNHVDHMGYLKKANPDLHARLLQSVFESGYYADEYGRRREPDRVLGNDISHVHFAGSRDPVPVAVSRSAPGGAGAGAGASARAGAGAEVSHDMVDLGGKHVRAQRRKAWKKCRALLT